MLRQRIITAVVLLAVLLPALFYPHPAPFAVVTLLLISAAGWEWSRLNGLSPASAVLSGVLCGMACVAAWAVGIGEGAWPRVWMVAGLGWVVVGVWLLHRGVSGWSDVPRPVRVVVGLLALWLAWLATAQARHIGLNFLLSVLVLVWVADVGAYFAGKALGRHKLAPGISPGKSWEGVWGGMVGTVLLALGWRWLDGNLQLESLSLYSRLSERGTWVMLLAVVALSAMSVVGDLVESLVKRSAGYKDSSSLLPGHGGVLDRVDALLPTLPLSMTVLVLAGA